MRIKKTSRKIILVLVVSFLFFSLVARADFSLEQWKYSKDIQTQPKGLMDVSIDNEVFANSNKGLTDVRVVDDKNQETPFKLITTKESVGTTVYTPKMVNNSVIPGKYSTVVLDLGEEGLTTNSLTIQTTSSNFQRNVTISGSNDQKDWNILKSNGYIYDYTDSKAQVKSQNTTVSFSESNFKFLKVEVAELDGSPVVIKSVTVSQYVQKNAQEFKVSPNFDSVQDNSKAKTTTLMADLGQSGIPTSRLSLEASDENFNRSVAVFSSNDKNSANWKSVGYGYIFRYNTPKFIGENNNIKINETTDRYFKIVIFNNDNSPLNFSKLSAFAVYRDLVFQAQEGRSYRLFYGNPKAKAPQYDLEKYFQYLDLSTIQSTVLGGQKTNLQFVPEKEVEKPFSERYSALLSISLVTAGIILLLMVYKFFKK